MHNEQWKKILPSAGCFFKQLTTPMLSLEKFVESDEDFEPSLDETFSWEVTRESHIKLQS